MPTIPPPSPATMVALQLACVAIVVAWMLLRVRRESDKGAFLARFVWLAVAAWLGEESCIRLYGFYFYSPGWIGFLDKVPVAIVCIWPVVVLSATDLARGLVGEAGEARRISFAALVCALVVADASLIEPIAVAAGLWRWTVPGPFHVPLIGILGWGFFAFGAALVRGRPAVLVVGPLAAHALLLAGWWLAFRWLPRGVDEAPFVVAAGLLSAGLTWAVLARRVSLSRADLLTRIPGAVFFFVLLAVFARQQVPLVLYALAFAPPYLALTARSTPEAPRAAVAAGGEPS
jgi:hypothetical protein